MSRVLLQAGAGSMSNRLQTEFAKLTQRFDDLVAREQVLLLLCGIVVIVMLGYFVFIEPLTVSQQKSSKQLTRQQNELQAMQSQQQQLVAGLKQDPNAAISAHIDSIKQQIAELDAELNSQTEQLVPARNMPQLLENLLHSSPGLKVIRLQSLPPQAILSADPDSSAEVPAEPGLYRHGVQLVVEGSYFDIQRYLTKLEGLKWQFYWKKFDYSVASYPVAKVEVEIYTLSTNKAFIGV